MATFTNQATLTYSGGDQQQRDRQTGDVRGTTFLLHYFAASFLGAPNFTGRPIRSSRTTQQFMHRMA